MSAKKTVEITNMSYIDDRGGIGLAAVKMGDVYLRGITVRERQSDGEILVSYPAKQGGDGEYYPVYTLSEKEGYGHDRRKIEDALAESYARLKNGEIQSVKHAPIEGVSIPSNQSPRVLSSHSFENGNTGVNVAYKNLIINNVVLKDGKHGEFASFPSFEKQNGERERHVTPAKDSGFSDAVVRAYHEHKASFADPVQLQEVDDFDPFVADMSPDIG